MSNQVTTNTQQEAHLLHLFRLLSPKYKRFLALQAQTCIKVCAEHQPASKPHLRLVSSEKRRVIDAEVSA